MTPEELRSLHRGDIVLHTGGDSYIIVASEYCNGNAVRHVAIREIQVSNPNEWTVVKHHDWAEAVLLRPAPEAAPLAKPDNPESTKFRCPRCGSTYFGSQKMSRPGREWKFRRLCHDQHNVGCRAVFDDDRECFVKSGGVECRI